MTPYLQAAATVLCSFAVGLLGLLVFRKLKIPAAALTGSMMANAVATVLGAPWAALTYPSPLLLVVQVFIGAMVGCMLSREKARQMKRLALPGVLLGVFMVGMGLVIGYMLAGMTDLDLATAMFAAVPGGMSEMGILAILYELNVPVVAMFHFLRVVVVYMTVPGAVRLYETHRSRADPAPAPKGPEATAPIDAAPAREHSVWFTLLIGLASGLTAHALHIPGGALVGSLVGVGACRSFGLNVRGIPRRFLWSAQIMLGASLGMSFTAEVARAMVRLLGVAALFSVVTVLIGFLAALILHKLFHIDMVTCLLACTTAGLSQMSAIAIDLEADAVSVSVLHCMRLIIVVMTLPPLILYWAL